MATITPDEKFIATNYDRLEKLLLQAELSDVHRMVGFFGERYAICPASTKRDYYSAFPGGLVYHTLFVNFWLGKFAAASGASQYSARQQLKVAVLADFGKVGTQSHPYYVFQESEWHRGQGQFYTVNEALPDMRVSQRSLFLAQHFGVELDLEEYQAISLSGGYDMDRGYKAPALAKLLQYASSWASHLEKQNTILWP